MTTGFLRKVAREWVEEKLLVMIDGKLLIIIRISAMAAHI
jgi:hypothetical protein